MMTHELTNSKRDKNIFIILYFVRDCTLFQITVFLPVLFFYTHVLFLVRYIRKYEHSIVSSDLYS